jgi:hypothetical protein
VLSETTWVWTEFEGKYHGCEYWSEAAWKLQDQQKMLVHEHAVPKSIVIQRLLELSNLHAGLSVSTIVQGKVSRIKPFSSEVPEMAWSTPSSGTLSG